MVDGKLYGRGGADDGYAVFCAFAALKALQDEGRPHPRCVILIECCEESGSYDLRAYLDHLSKRIRQPDFVVGLDSGCGNYQQLWGTTSLRGLLNGVLTVEVLTEGVTIPFMAMLGVKFPQAQFLITGVLGPHSNAHGPNEFLHIAYAKKLA